MACTSLILSTTLLAAATPAHTLRVTSIPEAADAFQKGGAGFTAWLQKAARMPVELKVAATYEEAVRRLAERQAELGWLGGVTVVQALTASSGRVWPILIREKDREFKSYVIAQAGLGAKSLEALRGKRFTFGAHASTSGHVMPRFFLNNLGLVPEKSFASVSYSGDHKKTALQVASGEQDCGAINYKIFDQLVAEHATDPQKVKVVWTSPPFTDNAWVADRGLDERFGPGTLERVTKAFLELDPARAEDRAVLEVLKTEKYVAAQPEWWRSVAAAVEVLGSQAR